MNKTYTASAFLALMLWSETANAVVNFDWATVGNPNFDNVDGYGGVSYAYHISKHEVTNAQYAEFLNAVDFSGTNALSLYNANMSSDARGGISFNTGAANGNKYEVKVGRGNHPVVYVSFVDAMRFVNWLHNRQGGGSTETGVYAIDSGANEVRSANATFWIPSEDEWYKAAYYDPSNNVYYLYPTGTNKEPYSDNPSSLNTPDDSNVANFLKTDFRVNGYDDGFAVTGSPVLVSSQNYLTDVGAYLLAASPYGTYDQAGNVMEWNEAVNGSFRGIRGGSWDVASYLISAGLRLGNNPESDLHNVGFRVAGIPEPGSYLLFVIALAFTCGMRSTKAAA